MAVHINTHKFSSVPEASCHLLPCEIQYNGEANVIHYFESTIRNTDNGMTASMHGRPLNGDKISLPSGYTGVVVGETRKPATEDEEREFEIKSKFNEFNYWNLDKPTNSDDKLAKVLQWIDIAKVIHSPITDDLMSQKSISGN